MLSIFEYMFRLRFLCRLRNCIKNDIPLKLNIGAGGTKYSSWISVEKCEFNITKPDRFSSIFQEKSIRFILAEHVIEHITRQEFVDFLTGIRPYLIHGGGIRIAVPDALHPSGYVRDLTKPGGLEPGAEDHKELYSHNIMADIAEITGYQLTLVEYFDENGFFHFKEDNWERGYISRSLKNYNGRFTTDTDELHKMIDTIPVSLRPQFTELGMSYTSLIVDFCI